MVTISDTLEAAKLALQDVVLDDNNMASVRYAVGDEIWKIILTWDVDNDDLKISIRKRS
jgi:hypothetical protein